MILLAYKQKSIARTKSGIGGINYWISFTYVRRKSAFRAKAFSEVGSLRGWNRYITAVNFINNDRYATKPYNLSRVQSRTLGRV